MWRSQFTTFKLPILKIIGELEHNYCSRDKKIKKTTTKKEQNRYSKRWKKVQNTFNSMYHCILLCLSLFTLNIILILSIYCCKCKRSSIIPCFCNCRYTAEFKIHSIPLYNIVCPCLFNPNVIILNFIQRFTRSAAQTSLMNSICLPLLRKMPESKFNLWLKADSHVETFWSGEANKIQIKFTRTSEFQYCESKVKQGLWPAQQTTPPPPPPPQPLLPTSHVPCYTVSICFIRS